MKVYFLRHGQTDMNFQHRFQGWTNTELNDTGKAQASAVHEEIEKRGISFDRVFVSPLKRAVTTAELATGCSSDGFVLDERIKEIMLGDYELKSYEELGEEFIDIFFHHPQDYVVAGGESFYDLLDRTGAFLKDLAAEEEEEKTVLVVSHGAAIHAMLANILYPDDRLTGLKKFWDIKVDNCTLLELSLENGAFRLCE